MTTQNIFNTYPQILEKISAYYGWDKPTEQAKWTIELMTKDGKTPWQAFAYLVEECLTQSKDRELDYLWFEALKTETNKVRAA